MRNKILALFAAFGMMFGFGLVGATSAHAVGELVVSNSAYSTGSILVCGSNSSGAASCKWVAPGSLVSEARIPYTVWKPQNVAVGAGWCVLYRVISGSGYGAWQNQCGGANGSWVYVGDLSYSEVQFIIDYHG